MANIYLDSCMIISLIEGDIAQQHLLKTRLLPHLIHSCELARMEVRLLAIRSNDQIALAQFDKFFAACEMINLDRTVFDIATQLRINSGLKTPDALHLVAAIHAGCTEFWTEDRQLKNQAKNHLKVVDWTTLES